MKRAILAASLMAGLSANAAYLPIRVTAAAGDNGTLDVTLPTMTASDVTSRTSCVAPCSVTFDVSGTTSSLTTRPFHDLLYQWDFDDPVATAAGSCGSAVASGTGYWACGVEPGVNSKNYAEGAVTAHVFESPGTYTVTLTASQGDSDASGALESDEYKRATVTITVTDGPSTVWAGTNTVCFSSTNNFTDCPSEATQVNVSTGDFGASFDTYKGAKRLLLRRGDTFNMSTTADVNVAGPAMVGAYGSGAKPIIQATAAIAMFSHASPSYASSIYTEDWRFVDLKLRGNGQSGSGTPTGIHWGGTGNKVLIDRVDFDAFKFAIKSAGTEYAGTSPISSDIVIQDITSIGLVTTPCSSSGENNIFMVGEKVHLLGSIIDNDGKGEHGVRSHWWRKGSIANNTVQNVCNGRVATTIRSVEDGQAHFTGGTLYNEQIYIAHNRIDTSLLGSGGITLAAQNQNFIEKGRDIVLDGNFITDASFDIRWPDVTLRNNIVTGANRFGSTHYENSGMPVPTRIYSYNNTHNSPGNPGFATDTSFWLFTSSAGVPLPYASSTFAFQNNIYYCPSDCSGTRYGMDNTSSGGTITTTNNSATVTTNPSFTTSPPSALADFTPQSGSFANGGGTSVPVWIDFYGNWQPATRDIGAVIH